ncbi:type VI secretion system-associated protein TagF [Colwellia sp. E150_009]
MMKIGYFGKLPGYGDFIQRNVSPDFVKQWDNWLLKSIESSRLQLGEQWRERYFNSPIWRFVISQKGLIDAPITGFMMPSIDKSGRSYPFTIICQPDCHVNPFVLARETEVFHGLAEDFALSLLEKERPDLDEISTVLDEIYKDVVALTFNGADVIATSSVMEIAAMSGINKLDFSLSNDTLLEKLLMMQNINISIWSMDGVSGVGAQKRYFSGMPPTDNYYSFLIGAINE